MTKMHAIRSPMAGALFSLCSLFASTALAQDAEPAFASGTFHFFDIIVPQPKELIEKLLPPGYTLGDAPNVLTKGEKNHVLLVSLGQVIESTMYDSVPLPSFYDVKLSIPYVKAEGIQDLVVYDIAYFFENPAMCFGVFAECQPSTVSMSYGDSGEFSVRRQLQDVFSSPVVQGSYQLDSENASTALTKAVDTYVNTQLMLGSSPLSCNAIPTSAYPSCLAREDRFSEASTGPRTYRVNLKLKLAEFGCQTEGLPEVLEVDNVIALEGIMPFRAGTPQTCPAE